MKQSNAIKLFVVFLIAFLIAGIIVGIYSITYSVDNHLDSIDLPSRSKLILGIFLLFVFDPMLFFVCWSAKQEHCKVIFIISLLFLVLISACVITEIIPLL